MPSGFFGFCSPFWTWDINTNERDGAGLLFLLKVGYSVMFWATHGFFSEEDKQHHSDSDLSEEADQEGRDTSNGRVVDESGESV